MNKFRFGRAATLLAAVPLAAGVLLAVDIGTAQAAETADRLPFDVGDGMVEIGCTWNNGCPDGYHGASAPAIDFIAPVGTPVYAAGPGTVVDSNNTCDPLNSPSCEGGRGRFVEIEHPDGRHSRYLHLSVAVVTSGSVSRGQLIGQVGNSGGSPVPHLHYDETVNGTKVDPGPMSAIHGGSAVQYPNLLGYGSWSSVPAWSDKFVSNEGSSTFPPENTRFTRNGSGAQYLSMRGAALPISYSDALAFDAEGNRSSAVYSGPLPPAVLPNNTVIRPVGQGSQFFLVNGVRRPIGDPATSSCLVFSFNLPGVAVVPASWADTLPTGPQAECSLPDHTRFTETGSPAQYISIRGAALPLSYDDAVAYDAEGLRSYTELPVGYVANPIHTPSRLPDNTVLRAVGTPGQYLYVGGVLRPVGSPSLSACLLNLHPQNGVAVVPASWLGGIPYGPAAACP